MHSLNILLDCHCHSDSSPDGSDPISLMCEVAIEKNLSVLCITDHCEINQYYGEKYDRRIAQSNLLTRKAKVFFDNGIELLVGAEMGQPLQAIEFAELALKHLKYDFVIGSLHNVAGKKDFYYLDYASENIPLLLDTYLTQLLEMCVWGKFDSLAHLTYPLRYFSSKKEPYNLTPHKPLIDEILRTIIKKEIALEINSSGLRQKIGQALPSQELVARYAELGGRLITVGSDAHKAKDVGRGIPDVLKIAYYAGIKEIAVFKERIPRMIPIFFE